MAAALLTEGGHALAHHGGVARGRGTGHGRVVHNRERHAAFGHVGETPELEGGAVELAVEARCAQRGLAVGQRHQGLAVGLDGLGQATQQGGALGAGAGGPAGESGVGRAHGGVDVVGGGGGQGFAQRLAGAGVEGLQCVHRAVHPSIRAGSQA